MIIGHALEAFDQRLHMEVSTMHLFLHMFFFAHT